MRKRVAWKRWATSLKNLSTHRTSLWFQVLPHILPKPHELTTTRPTESTSRPCCPVLHIICTSSASATAPFRPQHLRAKTESHRILLDRTPSVPDLQAAWLILLFCASTRANVLLRPLPPHATRDFAGRHDCSLRSCLSTLLKAEVPEVTRYIASLPLSLGVLGLVSATHPLPGQLGELGRLLEMVRQRHPEVAAVMIRELQGFGLVKGGCQSGTYHFWPRPLLARSFLSLLAQEGWGLGPRPQRVGPGRAGPQFRFFFPLSRHNFLSFFPLLGVFSWNSGALALKCARLEFLAVV